jgi:hypothetical protein
VLECSVIKNNCGHESVWDSVGLRTAIREVVRSADAEIERHDDDSVMDEEFTPRWRDTEIDAVRRRGVSDGDEDSSVKNESLTTDEREAVNAVNSVNEPPDPLSDDDARAERVGDAFEIEFDGDNSGSRVVNKPGVNDFDIAAVSVCDDVDVSDETESVGDDDLALVAAEPEIVVERRFVLVVLGTLCDSVVVECSCVSLPVAVDDVSDETESVGDDDLALVAAEPEIVVERRFVLVALGTLCDFVVVECSCVSLPVAVNGVMVGITLCDSEAPEMDADMDVDRWQYEGHAALLPQSAVALR